jgi:class 3 adenylate cyclase
VVLEPVRGTVPDQSAYSLAGLDMLRAYMRNLLPRTPLQRLLGPRLTQASSGTAVLHQVVSPWFQMNEDFVDLTPTSQYVVEVTALTGAPPGSHLRTVNVSLRYLRPCTVENEMIIGRGRILHAGSSVTTVDALFEDALGRAIAHATGSVIVTAQDPPPPPLTAPLQPADEAAHGTPDPVNRPLDSPTDAGADGLPPFGRFIGATLLDVTADAVRVALPTSEWFCLLRREVAPGIIGVFGNLAIGRATSELIDPDQRYVILDATTTMLAPVIPDGRSLTAVGRVRHRQDDMLIAEAEIGDTEGRTVAVVQGPCLIRQRGDRTTQQPSERMLLTVLFTDVVASTAHAQRLGDTRWRELLDQHNLLCRRQLALHKGREVKTTGDGVLATFDSPSRAVRCVMAIRDGLRPLGLQIRGGIHTGECELLGRDVAGLAVHIASRIQATALPDEVLISSTVRDLVAPSAFPMADRGRHQLKGVDGIWQLFAV